MELFERIKLIRTRSGLSQEAFAQSIGMKRGNYAQIEAGNQNPTILVISEIVRIYNTTYDYVIEGREIAPNIAPFVAPINKKAALLPALNTPKFITVDRNNQETTLFVTAKAAAGYLSGYEDPEYIETLPTINLPGLNGQSHRAFEIKGQSMMPTHHSGSIAIGRFVESFDDVRDRRVYIVVTKSDGIVLKRVLNRIKSDNKLILISDNDNKKDHPTYPISPDEVMELWYWRASIIRESPEPGIMYSRINDIDGRLSILESILKGK